MSERRFDPTTGEWVTFATHRQDRTFKPPPDSCPLCPDPEGNVDGEIRRADFDVVVFDNRFPSMSPMPQAPDIESSDLLPVLAAQGRCEVVVYSSDHATTLAELGYERVRLLVDVWADRYAVLGAEGHTYVLPFENKGEVIGVTLHHPHGQIYAFPQVPPRPLRELTSYADHRRRTGRCLGCDVVAEELSTQERIVVLGDHWVAHVPFWARFPYEVRIASREHRSSLTELSGQERDDLARVLVSLLGGYDELFGFSLPYVMALFSAPTSGSASDVGWDGSWSDVSHMHLMFSPPHRSATKLKYLAGAELMGGAFMTDIAPETAAQRLRAAIGRARTSLRTAG